MVEIAEAAPSDVGSINALAELLYGQGVRPFEPVRQGSRTFVARADDQVVGFVIATFSVYGITRSGQIDELAVAERAQGSGAGRELVRACEAWLRSEGVETIFVSVLPDAEGFYVRQGFTPCVGPWFFRDLTTAEPTA